MVQEIFSRYEYKYIITKDIYYIFLEQIKDYTELDKNSIFNENENFYTIMNIYYDTVDNLFNSELMRNQDFRQKLRMRVYRNALLEDKIFLELKKKYFNRVYKRRTGILLKDAYNILHDDKINIELYKEKTTNHKILKEIFFFNHYFKLEPKSVLCYERQAFNGKYDKDLRITIDKNLRCRNEDFRIEKGSNGIKFMPDNEYILEIKVNNSIPLWLSKILSELQFRKSSFSKFYTSKCYNISAEETMKTSGF